MAEFKYNLRNLRRERNITTYQLAAALRVARPSISCWESGKTKPSRENLEKLSRYFNVTMDYLTGKENAAIDDILTAEEVTNLKNVKAIIRRISKLTSQEQLKVQEYIDFLISKRS